MAEPRQKFVDGIRKVCDLRTTTVVNETLADEAWAAVKTGIVVARKDEEALDAVSEEEMRCVLEFLVQRGIKRKASKGQVNECLRILLARRPWLQLARAAEEGLRAPLREALAGHAELLQRFDDPEADEPEAAAPETSRAAASSEASAMPQNIKLQLATGCAVMKKFDWQFPHDPLGTKLDEATEGFQSFLEGITALTTTTGKASVGGDIASVLVDLEQDWANLLQFLLSMYTSGVRTTYKARIRFVVVNLRGFSPAFRRLKPWRELPWGDEPMPKEDARDEERRQRLAEDEDLARQLQGEEDSRRLAAEEARRLRLESDYLLAQDLQEQLNTRVKPRC